MTGPRRLTARAGEVRRLGHETVNRLARWSRDELAASTALDLAIAAALDPAQMSEVNDPVAFVQSLRAAWRDYPVPVHEVTAAAPAEHGTRTPAELRFDTLLSTLRTGVPPFSVATGLRLARQLDSLAARRDPFDRPTYAMDVAQHALISSSAPDKGRLLAALVRFLRPATLLDIGTAYGMSALYLATELADGGKIVTLEMSQPQLTVSAEALKGLDHVIPLAGASQDSVAAVRETLGALDVVCHDGAHSRDAYLADFEAYLPLMNSGSVLFLDDINWEEPDPAAPRADTHQGWQEISRHPRVRRAVELDNGRYGLLQLS